MSEEGSKMKLFLKIFLGFGFIAVSTFPSSLRAASLSWLDLITEGRDQEAAVDFEREILKASMDIDPDYRNLLNSTAEALASGCNKCAEREKIFLIRGMNYRRWNPYKSMTTGDSDRDFEAGGFPVLPSKALMDSQKNFNPDGLLVNSTTTVDYLMHRHAGSSRVVPSPFISTTYNPAATAGYVFAILKLCPDRVLVHSGARFPEEFEFLIPFFIHPNEIHSIIQPLPGPNLDVWTKGNFTVLYKSSIEKTDQQVRKEIIQMSQKNLKDSKLGLGAVRKLVKARQKDYLDSKIARGWKPRFILSTLPATVLKLNGLKNTAELIEFINTGVMQTGYVDPWLLENTEKIMGFAHTPEQLKFIVSKVWGKEYEFVKRALMVTADPADFVSLLDAKNPRDREALKVLWDEYQLKFIELSPSLKILEEALNLPKSEAAQKSLLERYGQMQRQKIKKDLEL